MKESPEQMSFFPDDEEFRKVMEEIRKEKGDIFPKNDEALKELARLRLANRKEKPPERGTRYNNEDPLYH
jgi:hypothetical protein